MIRDEIVFPMRTESLVKIAGSARRAGTSDKMLQLCEYSIDAHHTNKLGTGYESHDGAKRCNQAQPNW